MVMVRGADNDIFIDDQVTTSVGKFGHFMIKWGLISLMVLIPVILLPLLFLFARGGSGFDQSDDPASSTTKSNEQELEDQNNSRDEKQSLLLQHQQQQQLIEQQQPLLLPKNVNPLLLTRSDFTKFSQSDIEQTPRGSINMVQHHNQPIMASENINNNNNNKEDSVTISMFKSFGSHELKSSH